MCVNGGNAHFRDIGIMTRVRGNGDGVLQLLNLFKPFLVIEGVEVAAAIHDDGVVVNHGILSHVGEVGERFREKLAVWFILNGVSDVCHLLT